MEETKDNDWLICKACGYKIRSKNLKDVCPACGVNKKFFEPFSDNVSQVRSILVFGFDVLYINIITLIFAIFAAVISAILGKLGGHLTEAILPGK